MSPDRTPWREAQPGQGLAYRFLASSFQAPPAPEWVAELVEERLFEAWPFPSDEEDTAAGLRLLGDFCRRWDPERHDELVWDFNRLFVGPGEMLAPPWESVHRSKTGLTFQESTLEVRALYGRFGVEAPALHREPDDHLALELAFVGHLSDLATAADQRSDESELDRCFEAQRAFLQRHLLGWAPTCLGLVQTHAYTAYFRGVASLALGSLKASAHLCGASEDARRDGTAPPSRVVDP